jgi:hypothetical protein
LVQNVDALNTIWVARGSCSLWISKSIALGYGRPNTITVAEKCASTHDDSFAFAKAIAYFYVASLCEAHGDLPRFDLFVSDDLDDRTPECEKDSGQWNCYSATLANFYLTTAERTNP